MTVDKLWDSYELTPGTAEKETVEMERLPAANTRITEVRRKSSAPGTPTLGAIDEYARVSERYEYLTASATMCSTPSRNWKISWPPSRWK